MMKKILSLFPLAMISVAAAQTSQSYSSSAPASSNVTPLQSLMNANGTNFSLRDFSKVLLDLQDDMQQLLPMLEALNRSTSLSNVLLDPDIWSQTNANIGTSSTGSTITSTTLFTPETPTSINGTNIETLIAAPGNQTFRGASHGTNAFLITTTEQQGLRTLIILQHELERMLPVIESLQTNHFIVATFPFPSPPTPTNSPAPVQR